MTKQASDIKIGDTVRAEWFWIVVKNVADRVQKNGKKMICVRGERIFKNNAERDGVIKTWGDSAYEAYSEYRETTKVHFK